LIEKKKKNCDDSKVGKPCEKTKTMINNDSDGPVALKHQWQQLIEHEQQRLDLQVTTAMNDARLVCKNEPVMH